MEKWEQFKSLNADENISVNEAEIILDYCSHNGLPVPTTRIVAPGTAFDDGMTLHDFVNLNNFPSNEPVCIQSKWGSKEPTYLKQVRIAADNNNTAEFPGWEDYYMMLNFSTPSASMFYTKEQATLKVINESQNKQDAVYGGYEQL